MKKRLLTAAGILMLFLGAVAPGVSSEQKAAPADNAGGGQKPTAAADPLLVTVKVPVASSVGADIPLAIVNNEKITLEDLRNTVAEAHQAQEKDGLDEVTQSPKIDFGVLLKRLISVQLIVQEAGTIGLDEVPEIKAGIDTFSKVTLRSLLREELWKDITANEEEVERLYRAGVDEVKITLAPFKSAKAAGKTAGEIKAGKSFDEAVAKAVKAGSTAGNIEAGRFFKMEELHPSIAADIPNMKLGATSPVRKIEKEGKTVFVLFRLEERRTVDSETAKEAARQKVLEEGRVEVISKYLRSLYKKGVKTNVKLVESLEYQQTEPEIQKLLADERAVVEIEGESPVTVGQLTYALLDKLYHGTKSLNKKKWDRMKLDVVEELAQKTLLHREALKRGIDKTEEYKRMFSGYKRNVLFSAFMERVVVPEIKISDDELKAYYREHAGTYLSSEMVKIRTLAFKEKADAVAAMDKLRKGADFGWVRANAGGQNDKKAERTLPFEEEQLTNVAALPEDVRKAIAVPRARDFRLYEGPERIFYIFELLEVIPPAALPFEEVRESVRGAVFGNKLNKSVEEWASKLKESSEVKIFLTGFENQ